MLGVNHSLIKPNKAGTDALIRDYDFIRKDKLHQDIEFDRNSGATQTNSSGLVAFARNNLHEHSTGVNSTTFGGLNMEAHDANFATAPDGTTTAARARPTSATARHELYTFYDSVANSIYSSSIYVKPLGSITHIAFTWAGSGSVKVVFDIVNGTAGSTGADILGKSITHVGDGWMRMNIVFKSVNTGNTKNYLSLGEADSSNSTYSNVTGDGTKGILYWGAQTEQILSAQDEPLELIHTDGAAYQAPRFDYTKDGDKKGLLIEEARTNLDANSFAVGGLNQSTSFAASNEIDPSGGTSSYKVVADTSSGFHYQSRTYNGLTNGATYTYSVYVKASGYTALILNTPAGNVNGNSGPRFDLSTGQKATYFGTETPCSITECGNGWYKLTSTITTNSPTLRIDHGLKPTPMASAFSGDGSSGMLFWGSQLEQGSFPTSLIPTYGATASRSADIAEVTGTNFSRFYKDTEGTFVVDAQVPKGFVSDNSALFSLSDNSSSDHVRIYMSTSEKPVASVRTLSSGQASISTNVDISSGEIFTSSLGYKTNDTRAFTDHGTSNKDTSVDLPTNLIQLTIGHRYGNTKQLNGWIRRLRYFNKRKSDAQLQKLTSQDKLLQRFKGAKAAHSLRALTDFDKNPVTRIRREYDSFEADYTAAQVANGDLEKDFKSADQTTLPLDVSVEADEMVVGGDFTDLVINGDFATDSDWTKATGWSIGSGVASCDGTQTSGTSLETEANIAFVVGRQYTVTYTLTISAGSVDARLQGGTAVVGTARTSAGTYTETLTAVSGNNKLRIRGNDSFVGTVDNVSVVEGGWVPNAHMSISGGTLNFLDTAFGNAYQSASLRKGKTYTVSFDVISGTTPSIWIGNSAGNYSYDGKAYSTRNIGHHTETFTLTSDQTTLAFFFHVDGTTCSIDNVSLKEVNPIATGFSTRKINSDYTGYAMRVRNNDDNIEAEVSFDSNDEISLDSPVKATSMNLLAFSEDFGQWSTYNAGTVTSGQADPFGGNNASKIISPNASAYNGIVLNIAKSASDTNYTFSYYQKKDSTQTNLSGFEVSYNGVSSKLGYYIVNPSTGTCILSSSSTAGVAASINVESVNDDWWRISATQVDTGANTNVRITFYPGFSSNGTTIANLAGEMTIFGAQLEETVYEDTGTEKITNGDFSDGLTGWSENNGDVGGGSITVTNEEARIITSSDSSNFVSIFRSVNWTAGKKYKINFDVTINSATTGNGGLSVVAGTSGTTNYNLTGSGGSTTLTAGVLSSQTIEVVYPSTNSNSLVFKRRGSGDVNDFTIDNISVLEYDPELQSYTQTPVISDAHNSTSATNLREFCGTEQRIVNTDISTWTEINSPTVLTSLADADGANNAFSIQHTDSGTSLATALKDNAVPENSTVVFSFLMKKETTKTNFGGVRILFRTGSTSKQSTFILDEVNGTGVVSTTTNDAQGSVTVESHDTNWWRVKCTATDTGSNPLARVYFMGTASTNGTSNAFAQGSARTFYAPQLNLNTYKEGYITNTTGSPKTADVHCVVWYDQGMGEDATQSTTSSQPRLVKGSELVTDSGGKAALDFNADHDNLYIDQLAGHQRLDAYYVVDPNVTKYSLASSYNSPTAYFLIVENGSSVASKNNSGEPNYFVDGISRSGTRDNFHDVLANGNKIVGVTNIDTSAWVNFQVGEYWTTGSASFSFGGTISEMLFFPNMDTSPKRFPIEQNMTRHFKPYVINEPFDDNSNNWSITATSPSTNVLENGAVTATVVGSSNNYVKTSILTGTAADRLFDYDTNFTYRLTVVAQGENGKQIRFRDDTSNNGGLTTTNGVVTFDGTLQTFVLEWQANDNSDELVWERHSNDQTYTVYDLKLEQIGVDGFINTLYDQTGNNCHALQATAAYQPQLVSGGDLIKSGNHPAWEYPEGSNPQKSITVNGVHGITEATLAFVVDAGSDTNYLFPNGSSGGVSGNYGNAALDGNTGANYSNYGNPAVYVNGSALSPLNRQTFYDELEGGIKLVYNDSASTSGWPTFKLGHYMSDNQTWNLSGGFKIMEMIIFDFDHSNRTGIESNINDHYNIY